jgi:hypothetical protein
MGGEFNYDIFLRTFVNVTMYSQYNNSNKKEHNGLNHPESVSCAYECRGKEQTANIYIEYKWHESQR